MVGVNSGLLAKPSYKLFTRYTGAISHKTNLEENDTVCSNHRCHGHYLAKSDDIVGLLAEIMGKKDGVCGGRGGSQHLHFKNFYSNGVQGNAPALLRAANTRPGTRG